MFNMYHCYNEATCEQNFRPSNPGVLTNNNQLNHLNNTQMQHYANGLYQQYGYANFGGPPSLDHNRTQNWNSYNNSTPSCSNWTYQQTSYYSGYHNPYASGGYPSVAQHQSQFQSFSRQNWQSAGVNNTSVSTVKAEKVVDSYGNELYITQRDFTPSINVSSSSQQTTAKVEIKVETATPSRRFSMRIAKREADEACLQQITPKQQITQPLAKAKVERNGGKETKISSAKPLWLGAAKQLKVEEISTDSESLLPDGSAATHKSERKIRSKAVRHRKGERKNYRRQYVPTDSDTDSDGSVVVEFKVKREPWD